MSSLFLDTAKIIVKVYKASIMGGLCLGVFNGISRTYYNTPSMTVDDEDYTRTYSETDSEIEADAEAEADADALPPLPVSILSKTKNYIQNIAIDGVIGATYVAILPITLPLYGIYVAFNAIK